jgi:hypothetical protein
MDANTEAIQPQMYADKSVEDDGEKALDSRTMQYTSTPLRRCGVSRMYQAELSA